MKLTFGHHVGKSGTPERHVDRLRVLQLKFIHNDRVQDLVHQVLIRHPIVLEILEYLLYVPLRYMFWSLKTNVRLTNNTYHELSFLLVRVLAVGPIHAEPVVVVLTFLRNFRSLFLFVHLSRL